MLKTALKPKWLLALLLALLLSGGFVLLSQWQFGRAKTAPPPPASVTENPVELTSHFGPYRPMMAGDADQIVAATGSFLPDSQLLVSGRLQNDADGTPDEGYWVVAGLVLDDPLPEGEEAPDGSAAAAGGDVVIPVVRGWQPDTSAAAAPPSSTVTVTGRLLPTESPQAGDHRDGVVDALSVAELINLWDVDSYSGFVVAFETETAAGADASATDLEPVWVGPQPPESQTNWLNIFYGLEWALFAGFAFFLWTRLVVDDYRRDARAAALNRTPNHRPEGETVSETPTPPSGQTPEHGTSESVTSLTGRRLGGTHAQIRNAAGWFKVAAYITGVFLLLLVVEMTAKYGFGVELVAGGTLFDGSSNALGFVPVDGYTGGFNITLAIQIAHGWMYVLYLLCDFRLWMLMRWKFTRLLFIALGGVVPFLSFYVEAKIHAEVQQEIESNPAAVQRY
ncbi:SURF1 family cytochrome oxidase biogenesis protein [Zhihengliuella halotolerans]|uniref:SURF1-like protein n=1 Tax=Zhihengliuella halotolerans TaxID=370736 RepID=A0A4Q8ABE5_9MICC|nr:SURF1 family cytochrome oxidase biogenesis protein [Zhihengliuella halotolerans]RZU60895.1 integral membrane protein [Zhihengliuella halotolerans]